MAVGKSDDKKGIVFFEAILKFFLGFEIVKEKISAAVIGFFFQGGFDPSQSIFERMFEKVAWKNALWVVGEEIFDAFPF